MAQISDKTRRNSRRQRRQKYYESDSPGKLYTYVSAGNIETPATEFVHEPIARRGMGLVAMLAIALVLIWLLF